MFTTLDRIQVADQEYKQSFDDELIAFKDRIRRRAEEKLEIARKEQEEQEKLRQERLGPGGLDPVEVFETLPDVRTNTDSSGSGSDRFLR